MSDLSLTNTLTAGTTEDVGDVQENFTDVVTWANGNIDGDNFTAATNRSMGLNETGTTRRGSSIIATEQATSSATYTTLTTPDRVQNLVVPTNGLIRVCFQCMWKESVSTAARAALFIGANQLKTYITNTAAPVVQEADNSGGTPDRYGLLVSAPRGLIGAASPTTAHTGEVTTGQSFGVSADTTDTTTFFGGVWTGYAAAGTYTVSVQFKCSSGTTTAKERRLYVETFGFE